MKNIQFFEANAVNADIKKLCELDAICTCGIKYYIITIKDAKKYVIDAQKRIYSANELETLYANFRMEKKVINDIIKNMPDINIEFDNWDFVNRAKYGIYENDSLEIEVKNNLITIDLKVTEKFDNSFETFDSPGFYTKGNLNIEINNITIENDLLGQINILDSDFEHLAKAILKNINT